MKWQAVSVMLLGWTTLWACPPHEVKVRISNEGVQRLESACDDRALDVCTTTPPVILRDPFGVRTVLLNKANAVAAQGSCVPVDISACFHQTTVDAGNICIRDTLNAALDASMQDGLTYDDLEDDSDATLFATLHQPYDESCAVAALKACVVFEVPLDGDVYDVGCAVCAGGARQGVGCTVTDKCPFGHCATDGECALDICAAIVGGA